MSLRGLDERTFMKMALEEARKAYLKGEVPVGAVVVYKGEVLSSAHNRVEELKNPLMHAEILAILDALKKKGNKYLQGCWIYVTVEPCVMCTASLLQARIEKLVFGTRDPRFGGVFSRFNYKEYGPFPGFEVVEGVLEGEAKELLKSFFKDIRRRDARVDEGGGLENR